MHINMSRHVIVLFLAVFGWHLSEIKCDDDCPTIYSRSDWNATPPTDSKPLSIIPPPYVVVHHSATASCKNHQDCRTLVKSIQNYHMQDEGWCDIGYNFLIGGDGGIYEGRGWGIHGAHVVKYNARSIGICLLGNYQVEPPPDRQVQALQDLIKCGTQTGNIQGKYHLIGHRQGSATLCPGDYLYKLVENMTNFDPDPQ
ncbi:unnamed protein product [Phyllotreta striolata]|uniref:Peptidoglycan-recognition protein n=1 Tax=Phyllotreta striolata TaxID=444603 RepID=A0A9N9XKD7_PHYSR|nr:unnamed protein product [Phyllotreta striolata]